MKRIIYNQENGNAAVMEVSSEYLQDHTIEQAATRFAPKEYPFYIVDTLDLPVEHNDLFDAWEVLEGSIKINFVKAQAITKDRLRADRTPLMLAQDVAFQRALETGADTASIVTEKQRLRDITKLADNATTLEELKSLSILAANQIKI